MSEEQEGKGGKAVGGALVLALLALVACPLGIVVMAVVTIPASKDCGTGGSAVVASGGVRMPFDGSFTVTSPFNPNRVHPVLGIVRPHQGVDLALSPTGGSVLAAKNGKVTTVAHGAPGAGNFIEITHGSGLSTRYLHLASTSVEQGQAVTAGQKIGVEGNTTGAGPSTSTGAHLHFEVKQNGVATDPVPWLKKHGITLPGVQQSGTVAAVTKGKSKGEEPLIADGSDIDEAAEGDASMPAADEKNLRNAKHTKAMSIPPKTMTAYKAAAEKYGLPWQVLAGVGMEETHHGRITATSSAGAMGPMQMTAPTWLDFGTDGDGDGQADITNLEDSVFAAAKKLSSQGDMSTPSGSRKRSTGTTPELAAPPRPPGTSTTSCTTPMHTRVGRSLWAGAGPSAAIRPQRPTPAASARQRSATPPQAAQRRPASSPTHSTGCAAARSKLRGSRRCLGSVSGAEQPTTTTAKPSTS